MKAIILAAGYATRMYPLTKDKPKALLPIGGRAMLDYLMDEVATIREIDAVYIITNSRFASQFTAWAEASAARYPHLKLDVLDDGTDSNENRLGALGDIRFVLDRRPVDDDLLIAASDNFFTFPLKDMVDDFKAHNRDTLLGQHLGWVEDLKRFAVATLDGNARVTALVEKPQVPPTDVGIYALYLYKRGTVPLIYQYLDEGNAPDAPGHFPEWLHKRKEVGVYLFNGECVDIGTPQAYREVCGRLARMEAITMLRHILKKPGLFLGGCSMQRLRAFLDGYLTCGRQHHLALDNSWDFQDYVAWKYQAYGAQHWTSILRAHCTAEEEAFALLGDLLNEYEKEARQPHPAWRKA